MEVILLGRSMRLFQALQQQSRISRSEWKTMLESQFSRSYCQMFSTGLSSGERGGSETRVMLSGTFSLSVVCQPA